uniref:Uncharacterized protein n=1 Tax=Globisporangium ultimum (strain ATCC 200006 / CBS 805.95 / DAOM BR144) TaxID=431595 RepID=K3X7F9_GLOUD
MHQEEQEAEVRVAAALQEREEYLADVTRRVELYENCAAAISTAADALQELSANLDKMTRAAQQLNAFTGSWLAVWKRA